MQEVCNASVFTIPGARTGPYSSCWSMSLRGFRLSNPEIATALSPPGAGTLKMRLRLLSPGSVKQATEARMGQESAVFQPYCVGAFPGSYTRRIPTDVPEEASNRLITWSRLPSSLMRNVCVSFSELGSLVSATKAPPSHEALVEILLPSASTSLCFFRQDRKFGRGRTRR